ncbi:hypothetical protein HPB47_002868 [Ixodes persulcatus]|uniref:Uncharacterized protein n=1 Tax=Ixodes persulcatus TaxID=34615 RepID=A0AC60PJZ2_IXOPE|nr:hypothetical protein HPB47_002868 [Ixodes persulcatus]
MFAHVRYVEDNIKAIVPATLIRHFNPKSVVDYDKGRQYEAYWRTATGDQEGYYAAFILQLAAASVAPRRERWPTDPHVAGSNPGREMLEKYIRDHPTEQETKIMLDKELKPEEKAVATAKIRADRLKNTNKYISELINDLTKNGTKAAALGVGGGERPGDDRSAESETPTVSPVVSMPQSTEMTRESTTLVAAFTHAWQSMQREPPTPKTLIRVPVPEYSGHSDRATSATDFLLAIQRYRKATGLTEKETLGRVLPVALVDYLPRMRRELEERTEAPAEPFAEYLRAMQKLLQIAALNATNPEQVERTTDILAERRYHLPPAPPSTDRHARTPVRVARAGATWVSTGGGRNGCGLRGGERKSLGSHGRRLGARIAPRRERGRPREGIPQHRSRLPLTRCHKGLARPLLPVPRNPALYSRLHKGDCGKRRRPPITLSAAKQNNERVPNTPSTVCVPTAYRVGTATSTAALFNSLTVAGMEGAALLDSGASALLIGDEVLRHLQEKSVRIWLFTQYFRGTAVTVNRCDSSTYWAVLMLTPIMPRVPALDVAKYIYIESTSSCDATKRILTVVLVATMTGSVPNTVFIDNEQSTKGY